jgi:hypothetical protein
VAVKRPADDAYYVAPWSDTFLQGDLFDSVPLAIAAPPDAVLMAEGERRFISGPFDAGAAMLLSPSCTLAAQGAPAGTYALPARTVVPVRPLDEVTAAGAIPEHNIGLLRADRLRNYLYLPAGGPFTAESVALLYLPITLHHDVIAENRTAQLTAAAYWHLRVKLTAFHTGLVLEPSVFGEPPADRERTD